MKSVFISRKSWQVSMATCLLAFTGIMSSELQAQVKIGFEATKLKTSPSAIILQLSNDTSAQNQDKAAKALILPNVKATQQQATNSSMHQGLLHFNVDSNLFAFSRNKTAPQTQGQSTNSGAEWKFLRYDQSGSGTVRFLKIEKEDLGNTNFPKEDGTCYELTVEKKAIGNTLFIPYQRKENNNSQMHHLDGVQSQQQQQQQNQVKLMPRTRISYNGYALSPNKDYKIEIEPDNASTQTSQTQPATRDLAHLQSLAKQKVKITFLTLVPEKWEEFDEFFIEYEVI